ncbi:flippase [Thermophilibacter sp.]
MANLKTNIAYNFAYQLLILVLPLVTAPYLARVIGAEGVGVYSYSYSVATYFVYFVKLGLDNYGNRAIASVQDDRAERSKCFWEIYAMQSACFLVTGSVYAAYAVSLSGDVVIALLQGIYVLSSLFDVNWFFFGMEQFRLTVIRNTIVKILTAVGVFVFVRSSGDIDAYVAVMCIGYLVSQLALWPFLGRYVDFIKPTPRGVIQHIRPNLVLFIPVVAVSVYNILSKIILGAMAGTEEVGFFENAAKVIQVPTALVTAVGTVMLPRTSALVARGEHEAAARHTERTLVYVMAFTSVAAFGIPIVALPFTELFYGAGFEPSATCMMVLCATIPLLGFGNVVRTQYLIPMARDNVFLWSAVCGAIANVAVNLALIPRFGCLGAAFGSVAAEAVVLLYQLIMVRREIPLERYLKIAVVFLVAGGIMSLALVALPLPGTGLPGVVVPILLGLPLFGLLSLPSLKLLGIAPEDIIPVLKGRAGR